MVTVHFQSYPYAKTVRFKCSHCGKTGRTKTIKNECTVNPFNKGDDGHVLNPDEVRQQSRNLVERDVLRFLKEPVCSACEKQMSYADLRALRHLREDV